MSISNILSLFGGVALFLFGMSLMSDGLEKVSSGRLESILERLTSNVFKGVLLGAVVTGIIQSSAATTVMVVGFVNSGIMKLSQTVGIIMGANIGTTVTAQLLRLGDISTDNPALLLLKPSSIGPILSLIGVVLYMFTKKNLLRNIGMILAGLGILFFGMNTMETAVKPLSSMEQVQQLFVSFSNPVIGVLVGLVVTAVIQSSSASVGILQALTSTGLITFSSAVPIIFGQNIGTCITAILSSIGASKNAKRAAMIHLYFNVIGTVVFLIVLYALQYTIGLPMWNDVMDRGGIANFHLAFNVANTLLLLPFNKGLVWLAEKTIRDTGEEPDREIAVLDDRFLTSPSLALDKATGVVIQMGRYAKMNFDMSAELLTSYDAKKVERIGEIEDALDKMEDAVDNYLMKLTKSSLGNDESAKISELLHTVGDFERIGDYVTNLVETGTAMHQNGVHFSDTARNELAALSGAVGSIIGKTVSCYETRNKETALEVEPLEQVIDLMIDMLKAKHIERLKNGLCTIDLGTHFLELLVNMERISDHCSNVAVYIIQWHELDMEAFDSHSYLRDVHLGHTDQYTKAYDEYKQRYIPLLERD